MVQYRQVPYRYVNLAVYILAALVNSLPSHTFSSINTSVEKAFDYSKQAVTANALIFTIFHPIAAFPTNWLLDKYGSRMGCVIGSLFVIAGVWLRTFMEPGNPAVVLMGSCLAAFGNLFILNTPMKVAVSWFKPVSVPNIIFMTVLANLVSATLGAALPGLILPKDPSVQQIKDFVFAQAIAITIPLIILIILFRDKPEIPPSKSANKPQKKQKYITVLKRLFTNSEYMKILIAMTCSYGMTIAFLANLDQILNSMGYEDSNEATSQSILFAMLIGIVGTPIFSILIKKTKKYKLISTLNLIGCYIFFGLLIFLYTEGVSQLWALALCAGAAGLFLIPMTSLYFAYSAEVAFPIGEASAGGYLFAASQTFGFLLGLAVIGVIDKNNRQPSIYILLSFQLFLAISLVMILLTKEDLKRHNFQINQKDSIIQSSQHQSNGPKKTKKRSSGVPQSHQNLEDSLIIHSNG